MKLRIGKMAAQVLPTVTGYRLIKSSEQMGERWTKEVHVDQDIVTGSISNSASYFPYVQGLEQAKIHKARGWQDTVVSWNSDPVQETLTYETNKAIDDYYGLKV
jgi:hypothetical protein